MRQFITSGSADQEVPDISIFRRAFVDALEGSADFDKDGYLTGSELGTYIQKRTAEDWKGDLTPQYGKLQDPNLNKGDFVFKIRNPESKSSSNAATTNSDLTAQAWEVVKDSTNPKILEEFIRMFPSAPQRNLAKLKLMTLESPSPIESTDNQVMSQVLSGEAAKKKLLETKDCVGCDLRGARLLGENLFGARLIETNFSNANLKNANLANSNLKMANLQNANLSQANLSAANLANTNLSGTSFRHANLAAVNLFEAYFCNTAMPDGSINNKDCEQGASKNKETKPQANKVDFVLSGKDALEQLKKTKSCVSCDLQNANLYKANLTGANLRDTFLYNAFLYSANLTEANLTEANLYSANLTEANLTGANLTEANLYSANLYKANLTGANLTGANLKGTTFCKTTMPDRSINNEDC